MLLLRGPDRAWQGSAMALGCALFLTAPVMAVLVVLLRQPEWKALMGIPILISIVGVFLLIKGWRARQEPPTGLAIAPEGVLALAGDDRIWVIDWADLERVEIAGDKAADGRQRDVLKLSARGGGKSQLIVGNQSHDGFEVTVDSRIVREPLRRLAVALAWYRDNPGARAELARTVCIRHRLEASAS